MAPHPKAQKPNYPPQGTASYRCRVCRGVHALRKCQPFLKLTAEKRLRAVLINKYCSNFLAHEHSGRSCRSAGKCRLCQRDHHTLLHLHNEGGRRRRSPSRSPHRRPLGRSDSDLGVEPLSSDRPSSPAALQEDQRGAYTTTLSTLLQHKATSVLPTAEVVINTGVKKFELKALIDPCCPTSRISASLARSGPMVCAQRGSSRSGGRWTMKSSSTLIPSYSRDRLHGKSIRRHTKPSQTSPWRMNAGLGRVPWY
ncbi:uncharacterized protein LOC116655470 [Drosophila ananassae]|uniref:uncharacterized protein LOC116655470 n=1 Tax=Drosophila ananassae TaxID=7217 RepID=UPI001CFF779F|nr:uncharacterized protein LOC116655470 [Drosophila ananassae]